MIVAIWVVTALVVVAIGLVAVGREATRYEAGEAAATTVDLDDAARWVGDRLPDELTARLSYDEVAAVIEVQMLELASRGGVAPMGGVAPATDGGVVLGGDAVESAVVARAATSESTETIDAADVVVIARQMTAYLAETGAVGEKEG